MKAAVKDAEPEESPSGRSLRYRVESWKSQVRMRRRKAIRDIRILS